MTNLIAGVKKLSNPMFVIFVFSKILVGIGIGVLLANCLAPYGWWFLIPGVVLSLICVVLALKNN
ncbi:MAG: hypothetical protein ISS92_05955 [Candidatus Omnitrophica bacterium]|nr:hypothetical protein [Candidatus Omnitrophota bacterium]